MEDNSQYSNSTWVIADSECTEEIVRIALERIGKSNVIQLQTITSYLSEYVFVRILT